MYAFLVVLSAVGFGGWSVFSRATGVTSAWTNVLLMTLSTTATVLFYFPALRAEPVSRRQIVAMAFASLLNFSALVGFGRLMAEKPQYIPIAQSLMPVVTVLGFWIFLGEKLTQRQMVGLALVCMGIYLLSPAKAPA